jgi:hypothetical protein
MVNPTKLLPALLLGAASTLLAQTPSQTAPPSPVKLPPGAINSQANWPQPKTSDVDSPEHILAALYDVISGPAHQPRDWNRMRSLFVPGARLIPVEPGTPNRKTSPNTDVLLLSIDDYIAIASAHMEADGFYEHSIHNDLAQFGNIATVWSTYESRHALSDAKPFARGINSFQLLKDGGRYWIVDVYWDSERPETPLPPAYLPSGK